MHDVLKQRAADVARLAVRMRSSLDEAASTIPGINEQLATLAEIGIGNLQFEGPFIGCPPTGVAPGAADARVVYQAALVIPGGIGAAAWDLHDYHERTNCDDDEPVNLAPRFVPYEKCPLLVRALLVHHADRMLDSFMRTMQLLGF
ncbi:MAG: hypothetical protein ACKOYJ_11525 [Planctomycetia bacterium]